MQRDAIDFKNDKVSTLFCKLLFPTLLGTISIAAMTAIDGIVVGHGVGADGVAAVNIVVPVYQIMSGLELMVGAGCSVVASIHLSKGNIKAARLNITQAIMSTFLTALAVCVAIMIWPSAFSRMLGSSETLLPMVRDYLLWMTPGFIISTCGVIGLFVLRLDGAPKYAMWCNVVPALLNGVLDWLFVFPLQMGVKGAAIATSIAMTAGGLMALTYLLWFARDLRLLMPKLSGKSLRLTLRNLGYQCKIGSSSLLGELTMAVLIFVGNIVFMQLLGDKGVGAFGIACYYAPFFFMIGNAVAQSAQPIISYNYGIERWGHVLQARSLLIRTAAAFGVVTTLFFVFAPHWLVALFVDTSSNAGQLAVHGFPYFAAGVIFFIVNVAVIGYYQSVERMSRATLLVALRGFLFLVPSFLLMPMALEVNGAWLAMAVSEALTLAVMVVLKNKH